MDEGLSSSLDDILFLDFGDAGDGLCAPGMASQGASCGKEICVHSMLIDHSTVLRYLSFQVSTT
jgi:hypothetical protein